MKKVIVLGAPADQGIPLLTALKARGLEPTAGVRRPGAMAATVHPDVPEVAADLYDVASLTAAVKGQDALAMHLPFEFDRARRDDGAQYRGGGATGRAAEDRLQHELFRRRP